jgi:hypothetical protein
MWPFRLFTSHPEDIGETYAVHLAHAAGFGIRMMIGGLACIVHGVFPFLFVKTGSTQVTALHDKMKNRSKVVDRNQADA